jgi:dihydrodipicolinate synthase/N-acetylneuraminate lyase
MRPAWGVHNVQSTMKVNWKGVFPAIATQFREDQSLDLAATAKHLETLIRAGIHGVVLLGTHAIATRPALPTAVR